MKGLPILAVVLLIVSTSMNAASEIRITGSTTVYPIVSRAAEAYMKDNPEVRINCESTGSGVGIRAIIEGTVDIGNASRKIKDKEITQAREAGVNPHGTIIAVDGIAVTVNPSNPVREITIAQIQKIYTGEITNWKVLGGDDKQIIVISRDPSSGTFEVFNNKVLKKKPLRPDVFMLTSNQAVANQIKSNENAIGYIGYGFLTDDVKAIVVEGVAPSTETIISGDYQLSRPLYLYTNGVPTGIVKAFIDFLLSPQGQAIAAKEGFVPIRNR